MNSSIKIMLWLGVMAASVSYQENAISSGCEASTSRNDNSAVSDNGRSIDRCCMICRGISPSLSICNSCASTYAGMADSDANTIYVEDQEKAKIIEESLKEKIEMMNNSMNEVATKASSFLISFLNEYFLNKDRIVVTKKIIRDAELLQKITRDVQELIEEAGEKQISSTEKKIACAQDTPGHIPSKIVAESP